MGSRAGTDLPPSARRAWYLLARSAFLVVATPTLLFVFLAMRLDGQDPMLFVADW